MDPERAESIRSHWKAYRHLAIEPLLDHGFFRAPVKQKLPVQISAAPVEPTAEVPIYEYRLEHGYMEDRAMTRVVCEGVQVEIGPTPRRARS